MASFLTAGRRRGFARVAVAGALVGGALCTGVGNAAAQQQGARHRVPIADSAHNRITTFSPRSGTRGDVVTVRAALLPAVTPVQISFGGTHSGFEVLAQVMTAVNGELAETIRVKVPSWAERDRTYLFIVLDMYFKPLAASEVFHVTDPDGTVLRRGRIAADAAGCLTFRADDGELVLAGNTGAWRSGEFVTVEGTLGEAGECGQGTTLQVVRIQAGRGTGSK